MSAPIPSERRIKVRRPRRAPLVPEPDPTARRFHDRSAFEAWYDAVLADRGLESEWGHGQLTDVVGRAWHLQDVIDVWGLGHFRVVAALGEGFVPITYSFQLWRSRTTMLWRIEDHGLDHHGFGRHGHMHDLRRPLVDIITPTYPFHVDSALNLAVATLVPRTKKPRTAQ